VFWRQFETSGAQLLDAPGDIDVFDHSLARSGRRRATRHSDKRDLWETHQALEDRFGGQHFAAAYRSQLKARRQRARESLHEFATAIQQLAHRAYPTLPEEHIRQEAGRAFADRVEDPDIKIQLLLGGEKMVNEAHWPCS
jgi:hypothetical protein